MNHSPAFHQLWALLRSKPLLNHLGRTLSRHSSNSRKRRSLCSPAERLLWRRCVYTFFYKNLGGIQRILFQHNPLPSKSEHRIFLVRKQAKRLSTHAGPRHRWAGRGAPRVRLRWRARSEAFGIHVPPPKAACSWSEERCSSKQSHRSADGQETEGGWKDDEGFAGRGDPA